MMLSVTECQIVGWLVNNELVKIWKEGAVAWFEVEFSWRDWGKPWNISIRITGVQADIWSRCFPNTSPKHYHLSQLGQLKFDLDDVLCCSGAEWASVALLKKGIGNIMRHLHRRHQFQQLHAPLFHVTQPLLRNGSFSGFTVPALSKYIIISLG
jgi:hypothetical protein